MKTVFQMAHEALERMDADDYCREPYWTATDEELERFTELVRADEREKFCALLRQMHDAYSLSSNPGQLKDKGNT